MGQRVTGKRAMMSRVAAIVALTWQIAALLVVPAAACCQSGASSDMAGMPNCPMHHAAKVSDCPMHAHGECHCPKMSCSQTDRGFLALFGPIGVLTPMNDAPDHLVVLGRAAMLLQPTTLSLAHTPDSPPPRT